MNKKSKKRAFFVYVVISLLYISVTFRITEKVSMKRTSDEFLTPSKETILPFSVEERGERETTPALLAETPTEATGMEGEGMREEDCGALPAPSQIEPSLLIAAPIICYAIQGGWLEREGLIFQKKDVYNNVTWKKPSEVLKEHNEEGIKYISSIIGKNRMLEFMKKEGIGIRPDLSAEEILLGKGYTIEKEKLLGLYTTYVSGRFEEIFPFRAGRIGIAKNGGGFHFMKMAAPTTRNRAVDAEWMMPNLSNLSIKAAIEKLSIHTSRIKVHGNGFVVNQSPRAFERLKGEQECAIQGRAQSE